MMNTNIIVQKFSNSYRTEWTALLKCTYEQVPSIRDILWHLYSKQPSAVKLVHFHFAGEWTDILDVLSSHISTTDLIHSKAFVV